MTSHVTVRHTWEAGHRLPHLEGKCQSLHGHSWQVEVTVTGPRDADGTVVMFAALKSRLREWIDTHLDHGLMLGRDDLLVDLLSGHGKVYTFGQDWPTTPLADQDGPLDWPTVENVAALLARVMDDHLHSQGDQAAVTRVDVSETGVNRATWTLT